MVETEVPFPSHIPHVQYTAWSHSQATYHMYNILYGLIPRPHTTCTIYCMVSFPGHIPHVQYTVWSHSQATCHMYNILYGLIPRPHTTCTIYCMVSFPGHIPHVQYTVHVHVGSMLRGLIPRPHTTCIQCYCIQHSAWSHSQATYHMYTVLLYIACCMVPGSLPMPSIFSHT